MFGKSIIGGEASYDHKLLVSKIYNATSLTAEEKEYISNILLKKDSIPKANDLAEHYSKDQIERLSRIVGAII